MVVSVEQQVGAKYDENSAETHGQTNHVHPPPTLIPWQNTQIHSEKEVHISEDKHFQSARYGQYISTNISNATPKSKCFTPVHRLPF